MVEVDVSKDNIARGEKIQEIICNAFKKCGLNCIDRTRANKYDIDLEILCGSRSVFIEVEETSRRYWDSHSPKPIYPSKLLTMPLRKVKYFIKEFNTEDFRNFLPQTIDEFFSFINKKGINLNKLTEIDNTVYLKCNYGAKYFFIAKSKHIRIALQHKLPDQEYIDKLIRKAKKRFVNHLFYGNMWENKYSRNYEGILREDPVTLVIGSLGSDYIVWGNTNNICELLKKSIIYTKHGDETIILR
ncbi:MAG: hypothetical protein GXO18_02490 [Aquificae bacterium]|nr:hypothetical protein [Aquificota bacterium]